MINHIIACAIMLFDSNKTIFVGAFVVMKLLLWSIAICKWLKSERTLLYLWNAVLSFSYPLLLYFKALRRQPTHWRHSFNPRKNVQLVWSVSSTLLRYIREHKLLAFLFSITILVQVLECMEARLLEPLTQRRSIWEISPHKSPFLTQKGVLSCHKLFYLLWQLLQYSIGHRR